MSIQKNREQIKYPKQLNPHKATRRDKHKYCDINEDHDHTIEECRHLKDEIECLIGKGSLKHFIRYNYSNRAPPRKGEASSQLAERNGDEEPINNQHNCKRPKKIKQDKKQEKHPMESRRILVVEKICQLSITFSNTEGGAVTFPPITTHFSSLHE